MKIQVVTKGEGICHDPKVIEIEHSLENMQKLVTPEGHPRGLIQRVPGVPALDEQRIDLYVNEEGNMIGLKPNFLIPHSHSILGPVFFCSSNSKGKTVGLTDKQVEFVKIWLSMHVHHAINI